MTLYKHSSIAAILTAGAVLSAASQAATFYVALDGDDAWSGTRPTHIAGGKEGPLRTVFRAQRAVREERAKRPASPCEVQIRGGTHFLYDTLVFEPDDSGTPDAPVTYRAFPAERPILSGGRRITGWERSTTSKGVWTVRIPGVAAGEWSFNQLFVNGIRRTRARHPNEGYLRTEGPLPEIEDPRKMRGKVEACLGFTYRPGDLQRWSDLSEANIILFYDWSTSRHWVKTLDDATRTVRFTNRSSWPVCFWEREQRYYVENVAAVLDTPGEWHLDRGSSQLSYMPTADEDMTTAECIAPAVEHIVAFRGDPEAGHVVRHLRFEDLSFQHNQWHIAPTDVTQRQAAVCLKGAITATGAEDCVFRRCEIARVGGYAVWLREGTRRFRFEQCEVREMGAGGICLGTEAYQAEEALQSTHHVIDNCFIHHGGSVFPEGVGIWIGHSAHNRVAHNEISDLIYSGISTGWRWHYGDHGAHHNVMEWNHIHHLGFGVLSELSAIYTLGEIPGTIIRNNLLHDTYDYQYGSWGIGLDQATSGVLVENNILYNHGHGTGIHYGRDNIIRNNIIAFCRTNVLGIGRVEDHKTVDFVRNIVYGTGGTLISGAWGKAKMVSDYNCYWDPALGQDLEMGEWMFEEWQEKGLDTHSVLADPQFVDAAAHDFRLKPTSPALKLGFQPFDLSKAGLYGEAEWTRRPAAIARPPMQATVAKHRPRALTTFSDDFETTAAGKTIAVATTSGEENGASIRVTAEHAATGKHSLKFTDAPGLKWTWQPHLFYNPHVKRGMARLSFDVRLEAGAVLVHQWRDWRSTPFHNGPTLTFNADGKLLANQESPVCDVPADTWMHVQIDCPLGRAAERTYTVAVTVGEQDPITQRFPIPAPTFTRLTWIGFISDANDTAVFYLDNLALERPGETDSPIPGIGP